MNNKIKKILGLLLIISTGFILSSCSTSNNNNNDDNKYTVTFDSDNGSSIITQKVDKGNKVIRITDPTKNNSDFIGWFNNDIEFDFETIIESDLTLKAKWGKYTEMEIKFGLSETPTKAKFYFNDSYFDNESSKFSKDLALFSLGSALASVTKDINNKYFNTLGFDKITYYGDKESEYEDVCYSFEHKTINDTDLIVVSVRGFNYEREWINNFDLGLDGNHNDFDIRASLILNKLKDYINQNKQNNNLKLLLTGYSRGAAIINLLSNKILKLENKLTSDNNIYSYSFATPKGILKGTETKYNNVFNIVNEADLITHFVTTKYGFERCGTDIDVYSENLDALLTSYNENCVLPKFTEVPGMINKDTETPSFIINKLTNYEATDSEKEFTLNTRTEFVERYEEHISFILTNFFELKDITKTKIISKISEIASENALNLLSIISSGESLYNFLKPFIEEDKGDLYTNEFDSKFQAACNALINLVQTSGAPLLMFAVEQYRGVISRTIYMHTPVVYYVSLINYNPEQ